MSHIAEFRRDKERVETDLIFSEVSETLDSPIASCREWYYFWISRQYLLSVIVFENTCVLYIWLSAEIQSISLTFV